MISGTRWSCDMILGKLSRHCHHYAPIAVGRSWSDGIQIMRSGAFCIRIQLSIRIKTLRGLRLRSNHALVVENLRLVKERHLWKTIMDNSIDRSPWYWKLLNEIWSYKLKMIPNCSDILGKFRIMNSDRNSCKCACCYWTRCLDGFSSAKKQTCSSCLTVIRRIL